MSKRCLIIGASGEIGCSVTRTLVEKGYRVGLQYYSNLSRIEKLENQIPASQWLGAHKADLTTTEGIQAFLQIISKDWEAVVFCGGHLWKGLFQDMTDAEMDELYHVHLKAPWMISRHVLPFMIHNKAGNIVTVSSIFGEEGASMEVAYSSVKGAQISFVKALSKEVAPSGIRVNAVTPGVIASKMNNMLSSEEWNTLEGEIPLGRAGQPNEIADAISYLLSDQSSYVTGHVLRVNGGW
ncbi:elongation factor P 5-aminopentanone reductase [Halobacillus sp. B29]|uniref:elongation factor P 5-aminopentanone reductase n=1 Tax=Halobacillus sp. B29 TaxID=3457432 RepID=UPI003FCE4B00